MTQVCGFWGGLTLCFCGMSPPLWAASAALSPVVLWGGCGAQRGALPAPCARCDVCVVAVGTRADSGDDWTGEGDSSIPPSPGRSSSLQPASIYVYCSLKKVFEVSGMVNFLKFDVSYLYFSQHLFWGWAG